MSQFTDRLAILLIAATMLGGILYWIVGYVQASMSGTTRFVLLSVAGLLYVAALVATWLEFRHIDDEAPATSK